MVCQIKLILFYGSAFAVALLLTFCIVLISISSPYPIIRRSKKEKHFVDPSTGKEELFPSLTDKFTIHLSVVVPAYNEEKRLPFMLEECIHFLEQRRKDLPSFLYEIIVVSDGSKDGTVQVANRYCKQLGTDRFRVLELEVNRGKGGAVRLGVQSARGALILFADADGATKFADITKLESSIIEIVNTDYIKSPSEVSDKLGIVIGSRAHLEDEAIATRSFFRTILMRGFHLLVWLFAVRNLRDTQCGFKLLTRKSAQICFDSMHVERWAFDVELLYIAQVLGIPINEEAVNWTEIDGSKLTPVWSWIQMGKDLGMIWLRYTIGAWKIKKLDKSK